MKSRIAAFFTASVLALSLVQPSFSDDSSNRNFNFFFSGYSRGNYSMVACDYAEWRLQDLLRLFGATHVSTMCSGGINPWGTVSPLSLSANYDLAPPSEGDRVETVTFNSDFENAGCDFNTGMVKQLVREMANVKILSANDTCFSPTDRYYYSFRVSYPN